MEEENRNSKRIQMKEEQEERRLGDGVEKWNSCREELAGVKGGAEI